MSSGFVSGGTTDAPIERSDEWLEAQKELDRKAEEARQARQQDGKTSNLFETLQANKAAKEEAFIEANRLKNQFRALDEDEAEFLDSVLESTRAEEARIKKESAEGLAIFRKKQEEADKKARGGDVAPDAKEGSPVAGEESWNAGRRKRKRTKEKEVLKGVKIRRSSTANEADKGNNQRQDDAVINKAMPTNQPEPPKNALPLKPTPQTSPSGPSAPVETKKPPATTKSSLGLVDYGSDEDDDW
ncbi:hypothetical protein HYALB_00001740 [Hymenoscyphus albidus]|uniref:FAM192A/Fyv6 N-terminal domain-containing protein n=1 Tax=Hymenoscyphus albidus TaxID=595503 RepID=A0A9N9PWX0_9HELO|nr:hypothetical protein HYALB_00001740 [Hymenoscyphus albidus]